MPRVSANPTWSDQRERQYEHIKEGLPSSTAAEDPAEEIAARTVNKERARAGEAKQAEPDLDRGPLVGSAGRSPLAPRTGGADQGAALQRGEAQEHRGPLEDEQGGTRAGRRPLTLAWRTPTQCPAPRVTTRPSSRS